MLLAVTLILFGANLAWSLWIWRFFRRLTRLRREAEAERGWAAHSRAEAQRLYRYAREDTGIAPPPTDQPH